MGLLPWICFSPFREGVFGLLDGLRVEHGPAIDELHSYNMHAECISNNPAICFSVGSAPWFRNKHLFSKILFLR
jgi:hypothetical protein